MTTLRSIGIEIVEISKQPITWIVVLGGASVLLYFLSGEAEERVRRSQAENALEQSIRKTYAGVFALNSTHECLAKGWSWIGTKPTTADCINQTITAATNLRGGVFASEVREALSRRFTPNIEPAK